MVISIALSLSVMRGILFEIVWTLNVVSFAVAMLIAFGEKVLAHLADQTGRTVELPFKVMTLRMSSRLVFVGDNYCPALWSWHIY